jgi:hypothetical protein
MAGTVTAMAAVIGGTGFAVGTLTAEPGQAASPPTATVQAGDAARSGCAGVVYALTVQVTLGELHGGWPPAAASRRPGG